jgi:hypothetical protein
LLSARSSRSACLEGGGKDRKSRSASSFFLQQALNKLSFLVQRKEAAEVFYCQSGAVFNHGPTAGRRRVRVRRAGLSDDKPSPNPKPCRHPCVLRHLEPATAVRNSQQVSSCSWHGYYFVIAFSFAVPVVLSPYQGLLARLYFCSLAHDQEGLVSETSVKPWGTISGQFVFLHIVLN